MSNNRKWGLIDDLRGAIDALNGTSLSPDATPQQKIDVAMVYLRPALRDEELKALKGESD